MQTDWKINMEKTLEIHIKEIREQIAKEIEAVDLGKTSQLNGLGMKLIAIDIAKGK
jgi:hypothetical protein